MRHGTVQGDGLSLSYTEWTGTGNGPALVLLHGITGNRCDWDAVVRDCLRRGAERLSRIIALDARGHGESGWDTDGVYNGDSHFADVAIALDQLGLGEFVIAGYSMGGGVAMMVAASLPGTCRGLVVVDAYPDAEMTHGSLAIARTLANWWEAGNRLGGTMRRPGLWGGRPFDPEIARAMAEDLEAGQARRLDLWPFWTALSCPTLLIRGERSTVMPAQVARRMVAVQPQAELVEVPGAGHELLFVTPASIAAHLLRFMERFPGRGSDLANA